MDAENDGFQTESPLLRCRFQANHLKILLKGKQTSYELTLFWSSNHPNCFAQIQEQWGPRRKPLTFLIYHHLERGRPGCVFEKLSLKIGREMIYIGGCEMCFFWLTCFRNVFFFGCLLFFFLGSIFSPMVLRILAFRRLNRQTEATSSFWHGMRGKGSLTWDQDICPSSLRHSKTICCLKHLVVKW